MDDLGTRLKHAREQQGVALKDIAVRTKISVGALETLERNDFSRLPGGIFGRAFVRAYAQELGLDVATTVSEFQVHLERAERAAAERKKARPEVTEDDRRFLAKQRRAIRILRLVAAGAAILGLSALAWQVKSLWVKHNEPPAASGPSSSTAPPPVDAPEAPPAR